MNQYPLVSIYTCVYNGATTLHRVFESVRGQDYPNIEHVIVDDGSVDDTEMLCIEYANKSLYPVKYYKKENGGKHTALNVAWDIATGDFLIQLDADDRMLPHAISFMVDTYNHIPDDIRNEYWCVHAKYKTQHDRISGNRYPSNINHLPAEEARGIAQENSNGVIGLMVRKYLTPYRFPEVKGLHHVPEVIVWQKINSKYRTWYTNEIVAVYYIGEGGNLTAKKKKRSQYAPYCFLAKWMLLHPNEYNTSVKTLIKYAFFYFVSHKEYRIHNKYLADLQKYRGKLMALSLVAYPLSIIYRIMKGIR